MSDKGGNSVNAKHTQPTANTPSKTQLVGPRAAVKEFLKNVGLECAFAAACTRAVGGVLLREKQGALKYPNLPILSALRMADTYHRREYRQHSTRQRVWRHVGSQRSWTIRSAKGIGDVRNNIEKRAMSCHT